LYSLSNDYNNLTRRLTYTSLTDYLITEIDGMSLPKYDARWIWLFFTEWD